MTKRVAILVGAIVLIVILVAMWFWPPKPQPVAPTQSTAGVHPKSPMLLPASTPSAPIPDPGGPISIKTMSREDATRIYVQRFNQDHQYDWKVQLNFYGKVVDQNNQPVPDAKINFDWNSIGVPGGTAYAKRSSDGAGLFSITEQQGKILEVHVEKDGYYPVENGNGTRFFEYANPSDPNWYEPDPNTPVIFHLRKKSEGAKLFSKSFNVPLNDNHPMDRVNLMQGFIKPDGVLTLTSDTSHALPGAQPYPWTFGLSMAEGGLVETKDQFPFEAPTSGYVSSIKINDDNLDPNVWQGGVKKTYYFYLPSTNTYGRLSVDKVASLSFVTLSYVYNLTPGNRVLEPAGQ